MSHKKLIAFTAAAALGCVLVATDAFAAGHPGHGGHAAAGHAAGGHAAGGHAMAGPARGGRAVGGYTGGSHVARYGGGYRGGPLYDSCAGYGYGPYGYGPGYGGCPGYGVPLVGGLIGGVLNGYPY